ncbi:MAG: sirohydrochlorin chelatase [Burkholderiales bacterium]
MAIVLFAHGARDPQWAQPFRQLVAELGERLPGERIVLAYLELMQPSLPDCAAALYVDGVRQLRVVPVFFGVGGHLKDDLPKIVEDLKTRYVDLQITVEPPIGEQPGVIAAIADAIAR